MNSSKLERLIAGRIEANVAVGSALLHDRTFLAAVAKTGRIMAQALQSGNKVLFFGNGGSAADAQHLAAELTGRFMKERPALAALALTTNSSSVTALGNDYGFETIFARQIEGLARRGDVAVGISTSGNSPNVLQAIAAAHSRKLITVGMTGAKGGKLASAVDYCIRIPSDSTPRIQEAHILVGHVLCEIIEQELFGG
jgi:D-sedoheptulose 7-phosphate isomerase